MDSFQGGGDDEATTIVTYVTWPLRFSNCDALSVTPI